MAHNHPAPTTSQTVGNTDEEKNRLIAAITASRRDAIAFAETLQCVLVYLSINVINVSQAIFVLEQAGVFDAVSAYEEASS